MSHPKRQRVAKSSLRRISPGPRWTLLIVLGVAFLSFCYWIGDQTGSSSNKWGGESSGWWWEIFGGIAGLITGSNNSTNVPASVRLVGLVIIVAFLAVWRRAMLARIAYKPGPVDVSLLENATDGAREEPPIAELTTRFRQLLSETSLRPPPGITTAPATSFLDLVGDIETDPKKLPASIMRLLARLRPQIAYRIKGEMRIRTERPCYGITVTITSYAIGGCRVGTEWAEDWNSAIDKGASWVIASILAVTKAAVRPPWQQWRGRELPPELFSSYQQARQYGGERKFDLALHYYFKALKIDPLNPYIRNELSRVMIECGLYIDALDMIQGAMIFDGQREEQYNQRLWGTIFHQLRPRYLKHLRLRRDAIDVRYSYMNILGLHDRVNDLATQWCETIEGGDLRAKRRAEIHQRLVPILVDRYWPMFCPNEGTWTRHSRDMESAARASAVRILEGRQPKLVRLFFMQARLQEAYRLAADRPLARLVPGVSLGRTFTTLRIYRDLGAPLSFFNSYNDLSGEEKSQWPTADTVPYWGWRNRLRQKVMSLRSLSADGVRSDVNRHLRFPHWPLPWASRQWQDHYNAACVYAIALQSVVQQQGRIREKPGWEEVRKRGENARNLGKKARKVMQAAAEIYDFPSADPDDISQVKAAAQRVGAKAKAALEESLRDMKRSRGVATGEDSKNSLAANSTWSKIRSSRKLLADNAIEELRRAVLLTESGYTTVTTEKRIWMMTNDPDLEALRLYASQDFKNFTGAMYPEPRSISRASGDIVRRELATYDKKLLLQEAHSMEQTWHWREAHPQDDVHGLLQWLDGEQLVWERLLAVANVRARDWPTRYDLLEKVRSISRGPRQADDLKVPRPDDLQPESEGSPDALGELLADLHLRLADSGVSAIQKTKNWISFLRDVDAYGGPGFSKKRGRSLCRGYAAAWQKVAECLESSDGGQPRDRSFYSALRMIPEPSMVGRVQYRTRSGPARRPQH